MPSQTDPVAARQISLETIREAAATVYEAAVRTPLIPFDADGLVASREGSSVVPAEAGAILPSEGGSHGIYLKLETLQPIGSFKIRGAWNAVRHLTPAQRAGGVWTVSAGNAAQGVALAARKAGCPASVLVMDTAPATKLRAIERLGASIVQVPYEECWRTVESHSSDRMTGQFVHPFDDDRFISGNGTVGLEIVEDLPDVDAVIAPIGGGGLIVGAAIALKALRPHVKVYAAEPATAAPLARSLAENTASDFPGWTASFVDGAGGRSVISTMWPLLRQYVDGSIVVTLDAVAEAMAVLAERVHVIAEGAAGCAVAAALSPAFVARGHRRVVAIVSGGNIDLTRFARLVGACA